MQTEFMMIFTRRNLSKARTLVLTALFLLCSGGVSLFAAPANDNFADATALPSSTTGLLSDENNNDAGKEDSEPAHGDNVGGASVWYKWQAPQSGWFTFDTAGSSFDTLLGIYSGSSVSSTTVLGSNDNVTNHAFYSTQSRAKFLAVAGTTYRIAVDGYNAAHGSFVLRWDPTPANDDYSSAAVLTQNSGTVSGDTTGGTWDLNFDRYDHNSVWYSWTAPSSGRISVHASNSIITAYSGDGQVRLARTGSLYYTSNDGVRLPVAAGKTYLFAVSRLDGGAAFSLTWDFAIAPANDNFNAPQTLNATPSGSVNSTNIGATHEEQEPDIAPYTGDVSVWYKWTAPATGWVTFDLPDWDRSYRMLAAYTGSSLDNLTLVAAHSSGWQRIRFRAIAGTTYRIVVDSPQRQEGGEERNFTLTWASIPVPANDNFSAAETLPGTLTGTISRSNIGATWETGEYIRHIGMRNDLSRENETSVWFKWTAPRTGGFTFSLLNTNFDALIQIYRGNSLVTLNGDYLRQGYTNSSAKFHAVSGQQYKIVVDGFNGAEGAFDLSWKSAPDNDEFATAQSLGTAASGAVTGSNEFSTYENYGRSDMTVPVETETNAEGSSVWYRWTAPANGFAIFQLSDSDFDNRLTIYSGATIDNLTQIAKNDGGNGQYTSLASFVATAGVSYSIRVDHVPSGYAKWEGGFKLSWNMPSAPANDNFAAAQLLTGDSGSVGGTNVAATRQAGEGDTGGASVWYKWVAPGDGRVSFMSPENNFPASLHLYKGANLANLSDVDGQANMNDGRQRFDTTAGTAYYIKIDSSGGGMGTFLLDWQFNAAPSNDDFANALVLQPLSGGSLSGTNLGATTETGEPRHFHNRLNYEAWTSVWYNWTAPSQGRLTVDSSATPFGHILEVYAGSGYANLESIANSTGWYRLESGGIRIPVQAGVTYRIALSGISYSEGDLSLAWNFTPAPANDDFAAAQNLGSAGSGSVTGTNRGATGQEGEPQTRGGRSDTSVWYRWTPVATGIASFATSSSDFRNQIAVYTGSTLTALSKIVQDGDSAGENASRVSFKAQAGVTYRIAVTGAGTPYNDQWYEGDFTLAWSLVTAPPNDNFAAAQLILGTSGSVDGSNVNATWEPNEPLIYDWAERGGKSIWYKWVAPGNGDSTRNGKARFFANFTGDNRFVEVAVYRGSSLATLQRVIEDPNRSNAFTCVGGTAYYICVDGSNGADGPLQLNWTTEAPPSNDNFSKRQALTDETALILEDGTRQVTGFNRGAAKETAEPNHNGDAGGASVWFSYTAPLNETAPSVTFNTEGTEFYHRLAVYTCPSATVSLANLVPLTSAHSEGGPVGRVAFKVTPGKTYYIAVDGDAGGGYGVNQANEGKIVLNWKTAANLTLTVTPATFSENASQNTGAPAATGTVSIDSPLAQDVQIEISRSDDSEISVQSPITINAGSTTAQFDIWANDDSVVDGPQTVTVTASGPGLVEAIATLTVTDDDVANISVFDVENLSTTETQNGSNAVFYVKLSSQPSADVKIPFSINGTGEGRFSGANPTAYELTFTPGDWNTPQYISVEGVDDDIRDGDRTFTVVAGPAASADANYSGRRIGNITVTNRDDEPDPTLTIDSVSIYEGHAGTRQLVFTVSLSAASYLPVTVKYATADGEATAGSDYVAKQGTLTFAAFDTNLKRTIAIDIKGDKVYEEDETFHVQLSDESNATLATSAGYGTIQNDDASTGSLTVTVDNPADGSYRR